MLEIFWLWVFFEMSIKSLHIHDKKLWIRASFVYLFVIQRWNIYSRMFLEQDNQTVCTPGVFSTFDSALCTFALLMLAGRVGSGVRFLSNVWQRLQRYKLRLLHHHKNRVDNVCRHQLVLQVREVWFHFTFVVVE